MFTKRQKVTISALLLAGGLFLLPLITPNSEPWLIIILIISSYFLSVWSIYGTFSGFELLTLFVLPVVFTTSFALFLSRFPVGLTARASLSLVYIITMYTILLSENIFNVSIERNIPLVRAARTIGYLATLFVSFAFFTLLFGLKIPIFVLVGMSFIVAVLLLSQGLWQIDLKQTNLTWLLSSSLIGGLLVGESALALGFWPLDPPKIGLALTAEVYVLLGILQHQAKGDLSRRTIFEYLFLSASIVTLLIVSTSWGI